MSKEILTKLDELPVKFPNVFPPFRPLYPQGPNNNRFGFECGDGWYQLLHDCAEKIEAELLKLNMRDRAHCRAVQVKEKFGTLRFYFDGGNDAVHAAIEEAETRSETTCETCGEKGELRPGGWIKTECDRCNVENFLSRAISHLEREIEPYDHTVSYGENKGKITQRYRFKDKEKFLESLTNDIMKKMTLKPAEWPKREVPSETTTPAPTDSSTS